jgi:hypothetical protein
MLLRRQRTADQVWKEPLCVSPAGRSLRFVLPAFEHQQLDRLISETTKQNSSIGYPLLPINA